MNRLCIKDNSLIAKSAFSCVPKIVEKLADKTLEALEQEGIFVFPEPIKSSDDLSKEQILLKSRNNCFATANLMCFLGCGDERLAVKSRFGDDFFLKYLLERALKYPTFSVLEADGSYRGGELDWLVLLFPHYLKGAVGKGIFKCYERAEYNDPKLKGSIDLARHIKQNVPFRGNLAYTLRERKADNYLTELVRHTVEHIRALPYGKAVLQGVKNEVKIIIEATPEYRLRDRASVVAYNRNHTLHHAYFREYRALQQLCSLILQNERSNVGLGDKRVFGVLFDGAWLWEEYVATLVGDFFNHPMNKAKKYSHNLFENGVGRIYPDFISKSCEETVIADAKYKPAENIGNADYFQLLAYMLRFEAKKGLYFYPEAAKQEIAPMHLNRGSKFSGGELPRDDAFVIKHGLKIPQKAKNYKVFCTEMASAEADFLKLLQI